MKKTWLVILILSALLLASLSTAFAQAGDSPPVDAGDEASLMRNASGQVSISRRANTGVVSFARVSPGGDLMPAARGATPEAKSAEFFAAYGALFGVTDPARELRLTDQRTDRYGNTHLNYEQIYRETGVFGGQLKTHFDASLRLTAVNGVFAPNPEVNTSPTLNREQAGAVAQDAVRQQSGKAAEDVAAVGSRLLVYRTGLVQGISGRDHLVYEVEVANPAITVREFVYVDAHTGKVVDQISGIHEGLDREVSEEDLFNVIWVEGDDDPIPPGWAGGTAQQVTDWQNEIDGAAETYNTFSSMGGRDSYDAAGATMRTVNNDPGISCPNANWNGTSTNYCSDVTGDDTVAHEWGHAYTEHTSNLIYQWQSGALNESYSDIWGDVVDLLNGRGLDTPGGPRSTGGCSTFGAGTPSVDMSYRWLSGEDDPAFGGAIRDLWNPNCYGDPGKVTDTQYWCSTADGGGVHSNSGVPNHAFALMVDGGTFNGHTITALGLTKAAHIHWYAQENILVAASNFADHADALEASCSALTGVNLDALSTSSPTTGIPSGEIISAVDCAEVAEINDAVEFATDVNPICGFTTLLDPDAPPLCANPVDLTTVALEDWESGVLPAGWITGTRDLGNPLIFAVPDWDIVSGLPSGAPTGSTFAAFVPNPAIGDCNLDDQSGVLYLESPVMTIPGGATVPRLAFDHWVATESGWDGGNVKISVNGGPWTLIPGSAYGFNPYNGFISSFGEPAFTGTDGGANSGSWGQSQIDLTGIAAAGDSVQLRFEEGQDGCSGIIGWYVDNVHAYYCMGEVPSPDIDVTPASLDSSQFPDRMVDKTLTIANTGSADLTWTVDEAGGASPSCAAPEDIPWLSLTPAGGVTGVGNSDGVVATFDSTGVAPGAYSALLCVGSDDPDEPLVEVPVTLTVREPAPPDPLLCNDGPVTFDLGIPADWPVIDNEGSGMVWTDIAGSGEFGNYTGGGGDAASASSDAFGPAPYDTELRSSLFDLTGYPYVVVNYLANYQNFANLDYLDLDISTDGGATWTTLLSWNEDHGTFGDVPGEAVAVDLSAYSGMSGLMLRWRYYDPNSGDDWNWYAQVDDVYLECGDAPADIEVDPTSVSSSQLSDVQVDKGLTIKNVGGADLTWSLEEEPVAASAPEIAAGSVERGSPMRLGPTAESSVSAKRGQDLMTPSFDDVIQDGGFETGTPNAAWDEYSLNFGTPLCDLGCGTGTGTGPHSGDFWAWFGGIDAYEEGSVSQMVTIPAETPATLTFYLEAILCDSDADYLEVLIDGASVYYIDGGSPLCGVLGYSEQVVDVSAYADGGDHVIEFHSETFANNGGGTNFFVDDVQLGDAPACSAPSDVPWLAVSSTGGVIIPGSSEPLTVTLDSTGLAPGLYEANLCVSSNDADEPVVQVPVSMEVIVDGPTLSIPVDIPAIFAATVVAPVNFDSKGFSIAATTFSVDFDESCLAFDPTDGDSDGIPDAITFLTPADFTVAASYDGGDTDGEIDFLIADLSVPLATLTDGSLATIEFTTTCEPPAGATITAPVGFSTEPSASFSDDTGASVPGSTADGSVMILSGIRGDCNHDGVVDAGDITACVLEIFDGDGNFWLDAPGGSFLGSPVGCDSNGDGKIDAGDIICTVLIIFNGPDACGGLLAADAQAATLKLDSLATDGVVNASVSLQGGAGRVGAAVYSLRYDRAALRLDPTDANGDGVPDAIAFGVPAGFAVAAQVDEAAGVVKLYIADIATPIAALPDGALTAIRFQQLDAQKAAGLAFSDAVPASLGSVDGMSLAVETVVVAPDAGAATLRIFLPTVQR